MRRRVDVHLTVNNLAVPGPWRVGRTTFYPAHSVSSRLRESIARQAADHADRPGDFPPTRAQSLANRDQIVSEFDDAAGDRPTISVPAWLDSQGKLTDAALEGARSDARDAIAALRLLQHIRVPFDTQHQRFGLASDVGWVIEPRLITDLQGEMTGAGWSTLGVGGTWAFSSADVRYYHRDTRFAWLDRALAAPDSERTEWQRRLVVALRTLSLANASQRPATRIVLIATAYEALVGDDYRPGKGATGAHGLARRAAYWWCGTDIHPPRPHGPTGRYRCPFLNTSDPTGKPEASGWMCTWYDDLRALSADRNAALHAAEDRFSHKQANHHEFMLDRVIEQGLGWLTATGAATLDELDREIGSIRAAPRHSGRCRPESV
jgi:hypothetical protein